MRITNTNVNFLNRLLHRNVSAVSHNFIHHLDIFRCHWNFWTFGIFNTHSFPPPKGFTPFKCQSSRQTLFWKLTANRPVANRSVGFLAPLKIFKLPTNTLNTYIQMWEYYHSLSPTKFGLVPLPLSTACKEIPFPTQCSHWCHTLYVHILQKYHEWKLSTYHIKGGEYIEIT